MYVHRIRIYILSDRFLGLHSRSFNQGSDVSHSAAGAHRDSSFRPKYVRYGNTNPLQWLRGSGLNFHA